MEGNDLQIGYPFHGATRNRFWPQQSGKPGFQPIWMSRNTCPRWWICLKTGVFDSLFEQKSGFIGPECRCFARNPAA
jgi:hypothetical protein